ncbi:MAG: Shikimate dehydrogenase [Planctomycetota bacterium]|jgi:shikimate dehydrogenase
MTSPALQEVVALLGCPAAGNPAQYLFERLIAAAGLDWQFVTLDVPPEHLDAAIRGVAALGLRGCLLSGPLRAAALGAVASASPAATFSGAVSLIERQPAGPAGHMTDGRGVVEALRSHIDPAGAVVLVVGAGAAARATALELSLARAAEILVCDRTPERAESLVAALSAMDAAPAAVLPFTAEVVVPDRVGIVVSAVPAVGPKPAVPLTGLRPDLVVADLALVSQPAPVVSAARAAGACVVDGIEIHCERTAIDFHALTGLEADTELLREALDEFLSA